MSGVMIQRNKSFIVVLLGILTVVLLAVWGCGDSNKEYDNPSTEAVTTKTATALIQAADLKQWMDAGLVNRAERI